MKTYYRKGTIALLAKKRKEGVSRKEIRQLLKVNKIVLKNKKLNG